MINVHWIDPLNIGDCVCSPCHYFPIPAREVNIPDARGETEAVLLGGGACLDFVTHADVVWGAGMTSKQTRHPNPPAWLSHCRLAGIRDFVAGFRWVPCVSCMSPLFDLVVEPVHEIVVFRNFRRPPIYRPGAPCLSNRVKTMDEAVAFLGSGRKVVTNSYHGAYWAQLLGRDVEIVDAYSSKFFQFKPRLTLEECRDANLAFWRDAEPLLRS